MDLTDKQWEVLAPLLPKARVRKDKRGRPWRDPRDVLNGILWVLRTGAPWDDLPDRYPSKSTCHRRFQSWLKSGTMTKLRAALLNDLDKRGKTASPHRGQVTVRPTASPRRTCALAA